MAKWLDVHGTAAGSYYGAYTVVAADDTAGSTVIATRLNSIDWFHVEIRRSGAIIANDDNVVTVSGGDITVADGGSNYTLTAGDVIYWEARGRGGI